MRRFVLLALFLAIANVQSRAMYKEFYFGNSYRDFVESTEKTLIVTTGECMCQHMEETVKHLVENLPEDVTVVRQVAQNIVYFPDKNVQNARFYPGETENEIAVTEWFVYTYNNMDKTDIMGSFVPGSVGDTTVKSLD
jgi:hypothetical protein